MINVLIVDDEENTRTGLSELPIWKDMNVASVMTAENGIAALELMKSFIPSILITDIKMPKLDGVELSRIVREKYNDCGIIFLSGYSDKEYLKNAIHVNAAEYLEKPVEIKALKDACNRIISKIDENNRKIMEIRLKEMQLKANWHLICQQLTIDLVLGVLSAFEVKQRYGTETINSSIDHPFQILCAKINWNPNSNPASWAFIRDNLLKKINSDFGNSALCGFVGGDIFAAILVSQNVNDSFWVNISHISLLFSKYLSPDHSYAFAHSHTQVNWNLISSIYKDTLNILDMQFYMGEKQVYNQIKAQRSTFVLKKQFYHDFKEQLRRGNSKNAVIMVKNITEEIKRTLDNDIGKIRNIYFNLIRILYDITMQWDVFGNGGQDEDISYIWRDINSKITLDSLAHLVIDNIENIMEQVSTDDLLDIKISKVKNYILNHFTDNQISIKKIAHYAGLSEPYLCGVFKKNTGKTINAYISELRIEKACQLLKNRHVKLYEICSMIGLTDSNYFTQLFKKYTGLTPSEYRERVLNED